MPSTVQKTVKPTGGDFTSVNAAVAWFHTNHPNLTADDIIAEVLIDGTWASPDTTQLTVPALVSDGTRYLWVHTASAARHHGVLSSNYYQLSVSGGNGIYQNNPVTMHVDGLQIIITGSSGSGLSAFVNSDLGTTWLSNCIIKGAFSGTATNCYAIAQNYDSTLYMWNCIVYGWINGTYPIYAVMQNSAGAVAYFYNNTFVSYYGVRKAAGTTFQVKNCYSAALATQCYWQAPTATSASSDQTGTAGMRGIVCDAVVGAGHAGFVSVTPGSEDFHLQAGSPLIGIGTDTHAEGAPLNFTTDIDGDSRS